MNGAEVRILYGDTRSNLELRLTYANIPDATAEQFFEHYYEHHGTFETFALPAPNNVAKGWTGSSTFFNAGSRVQYRWAEPPSLEGVRPGRSTVTVNLVGVQV